MTFAGDYAGTLNGLAFGAGTAYAVQGLTGWLDMAEAPLGGGGSLVPKQTRNGSWTEPNFMPTRVVTMALKIQDVSGPFEAAIDALAAATQPGVGEVPLTLQVGGVPTTAVGTVTARSIPTTLDYLAGYTTAQLEVTCTDPRRFGTATTGTTLLPASTGGLVWPVTWPLVWNSTRVTGQAILTNPGDATGPVTMRIDGPVTGPMVTHTESGLTLAFAPTFKVAAGDWVDIDCEARTALYNGQSSRSGYIIVRGWPVLLSGVNTFTFNAAVYDSAAQLQVTGTPSWI